MEFESNPVLDTEMNLNKANLDRFSFLNSLSLDQDVKRRLSLHLNGIINGNDEIFVTPLAKSHDPQDVLENWNKIFDNNNSLIHPDLNDLEMTHKEKFKPRSVSVPWSDRKSSLTNYFEYSLKPEQFTQLARSLPSSGSLRPLSFVNAMNFIKNNTNSGLPFYTKKGKVKQKVLSDTDYLLNRKDPCILFSRTQDFKKTRNVWGYPVIDTLNEMRIYRPLLDYQKELSWRAALRGPKSVDLHLSEIINQSDDNKCKLLSIDFSAYDASVGRDLQSESFKYIKSLFQPSAHSEIDYINDRFTNIGIVTPDGVINGSHGVPSGSTLTNEVDSIAQYLLAVNSGYVNESNFQIQGDDGAYSLKEDDVYSLKQHFSRFGLNVNDTKSFESYNYLVYLQCMYHKFYRKNGFIGGIYPTYRALNRILYQERWSNFEDYDLDGIDYYSLRTISILENCKYHPLFKELVRFVYNLDKYCLRFSQKSVVKYVEFYNQGSGVGGVINNQYGDDLKGINSFETVKLIKSFA